MVLIRVDLPQPFGPRIATCSPAPMLSVMSWSTCLSPSITETRWKANRGGRIGGGVLIRFSRFESILADMRKSACDLPAATLLLGRVRAIGLEFDHGQRLQ